MVDSVYRPTHWVHSRYTDVHSHLYMAVISVDYGNTALEPALLRDRLADLGRQQERILHRDEMTKKWQVMFLCIGKMGS